MIRQKIKLSAFEPVPEFFCGYDRILVSFSGGEGSLAAVLALLEVGVPSNLIWLFYRHEDGREIKGIPISEAYCMLVADMLDVKLARLPTYYRPHLSMGNFIVKNCYNFAGATLVVSGERRLDWPARRALVQFENHMADNRHPGKHKRRLRYVDHLRPILHWNEERMWKIIDDYGVIDFINGKD